ncbi:arsenite efflux transporter metallochaperone ArsD [Mangrovibacillus sp. Mu-81]|uniref:arsenite efflux transporter metallochaperone ArsD n=1 Tax=Bacillaceae TaxID=186817 RepID=UPI0024958CA2|nr:arsenite efflux transporter metallochaperone ArsD [Rossellomorea aquimaris]
MKKVEIYDPAMCCSTGVCGPSVDPELTRVATAIYSLKKRNFDITRYNLTNEPGQFANNSLINSVLHEKGPDALPVVLVNDKVEKMGSYPSNEEFAEWFEVKPEELNEKPKTRLSIDLNQL